MDKSIKIVTPKNSAPAGGHYSKGIVYNGVLYVSGQLPVNADGSHTHTEPFDVQARQTLNNLFDVLAGAGTSPANLLKVTVYVADMEYWKTFNEIYAAMMGEAKPTRTVIPVSELHYGYLVEIDAIAAVIDPQT